MRVSAIGAWRYDRTIYQGALAPVLVLTEWMQIRALCAWPAVRRPETYGAPIRRSERFGYIQANRVSHAP